MTILIDARIEKQQGMLPGKKCLYKIWLYNNVQHAYLFEGLLTRSEMKENGIIK